MRPLLIIEFQGKMFHISHLVLTKGFYLSEVGLGATDVSDLYMLRISNKLQEVVIEIIGLIIGTFICK